MFNILLTSLNLSLKHLTKALYVYTSVTASTPTRRHKAPTRDTSRKRLPQRVRAHKENIPFLIFVLSWIQTVEREKHAGEDGLINGLTMKDLVTDNETELENNTIIH